jgi:hypothetical protein
MREETMTIDLRLTGLVVAVACFYIIRKLMKPGGGCAGGCGCSSKEEGSKIVDLRDKDKQE